MIVTHPSNTHRHAASHAALRLALVLGAGLMISGCAGVPTNAMLDSVHQPVVAHTDYTFDMVTGVNGASQAEKARLAGWFDTMDLRYGDRVAIEDPLTSEATRSAVEQVAAHYGILVSRDVPASTGYVNAGTARVLITRATASVPHCPDWSGDDQANPYNATSTNFGCAVNSNLAVMVANPDDLLHGAASNGQTTARRSAKAIDSLWATPTAGANTATKTSTKGGE